MNRPIIRSPSGRHILSPRILLVDDEPAVLRALQRVLKSWLPLAEIRTAHDGRRAVELLDEHEFHLMITDLEMPSVSGISLLAYASSRCPQMVRFAHSARLQRPGFERVSFLAHRVIAKGASAMEVLDATRWALDLLANRPNNKPRRHAALGPILHGR